MNKDKPAAEVSPEEEFNLPEDADAEIKRQRAKRFVDTDEDKSLVPTEATEK